MHGPLGALAPNLRIPLLGVGKQPKPQVLSTTPNVLQLFAFLIFLKCCTPNLSGESALVKEI